MPLDEFSDSQAAASSLGNRSNDNGCATCHQGNWIHVRYDYTEGDPITDAAYVVQKPNNGTPGGEVIAEGVLAVGPGSSHKFAHVDLGDYNGEVEVFFFDDPTEPVPFNEPQPVQDERNWLQRAADGVMSGALWAGEVVQGDFNENMSTGQIITNAVVTAVPGIDQVADVHSGKRLADRIDVGSNIARGLNGTFDEYRGVGWRVLRKLGRTGIVGTAAAGADRKSRETYGKN